MQNGAPPTASHRLVALPIWSHCSALLTSSLLLLLSSPIPTPPLPILPLSFLSLSWLVLLSFSPDFLLVVSSSLSFAPLAASEPSSTEFLPYGRLFAPRSHGTPSARVTTLFRCDRRTARLSLYSCIVEGFSDRPYRRTPARCIPPIPSHVA